jgi:hypothetical protein
LVVLLALGCSAAGGVESMRGPPGAGGGTGGTDIGATPASLEFESRNPLPLLPGTAHTLSVHASPTGVYRVRFALLGEAKNASLDRSEADTDEDGTVDVRLIAPTSSTTFRVRASVATVTAEASVSVSKEGFAVLQVDPSYSGGRDVPYWVASASANVTCDAFKENPPPDLDLVASTLSGQSPQISNVPVGPVLAVTLRAGYFAGGCVEVANLVPDEVNRVTVVVTNRPLQLEQTNLEIALGVSEQDSSFRQALEPALQAARDAIRGEASNDVEALLEALITSAPTPDTTQALSEARVADAWDDVLSPLGPNALWEHIEPWLRAGAARMVGAQVFSGALSAAGRLPGLAQLELDAVGGVPIAATSITRTVLASWAADPDDTVLLATTPPSLLGFSPSRLITALAQPAALAEAPSAQNVPEALAQIVGCQDVGTALAEVSTIATCDARCLEDLCRAALGELWQRARDASGTTVATLRVNLTGQASIDEYARPVGFDGSWVGKLESDGFSGSVSGEASGWQQLPPN